VRNHVSNVMAKLGVSERSEAVDPARLAGPRPLTG
jgi:DNA-binding NarL/FixJ family response regulator